MKGKTCSGRALEMPAQKTRKTIRQRVGWSKTASPRRHVAAVDVDINTIILRVTMAANPKRQSLAHASQPKEKLKATPTRMKTNQKAQLKSERLVIRRKMKIGSFLKSNLLIIKSAARVKTKSEMPKTNASVNPLEGTTA